MPATTTRPTDRPATQRAAGPGAIADTLLWHWRNARPATRALAAAPLVFVTLWAFTSLATALTLMGAVATGALVASLATPRTRAWTTRQILDIPATIRVRYHWGWAMRQADMPQPTRYVYRLLTGRRERTPRIRQVRTQPDGTLVITAEQLRGQGHFMWGRARDEIGNALERGMPDIDINPDRRVVTITCPPPGTLASAEANDPTRPIPTWTPEPPAPLPDLKALPVARTATGEPWHLALLGKHLLVVGESGAGKGSVIWSILTQLAPAIRDGWVQVIGLDGKGGVELFMGEHLFTHLYAPEPQTPGGRPWQEGMCVGLEKVVADMQYRQTRMRGRTRLHTPSRAEPLILVIVDEFLALTAGVTEPRLAKRIDAALTAIESQGRAVGYSLVALSQAGQKEAIGATTRDMFTLRILLRVTDQDQVDMVLGRGALKAGARAHEIPEKGAEGTGFVVEEGRTRSTLIRFPWTSDERLAEIATMYRAPRPMPVVRSAPEPAPVPEAGGEPATPEPETATAPAAPSPVSKREALEATIRAHTSVGSEPPTAEALAVEVGCSVRYARRILAEVDTAGGMS